MMRVPPLHLRSTDLVWETIEGEIVALDMRAWVYISINSSGAILWPTLAAGTTREDLVTRLSDAFSLDRASAEKDVDAFVRALREQGLLDS